MIDTLTSLFNRVNPKLTITLIVCKYSSADNIVHFTLCTLICPHKCHIVYFVHAVAIYILLIIIQYVHYMCHVRT